MGPVPGLHSVPKLLFKTIKAAGVGVWLSGL